MTAEGALSERVAWMAACALAASLYGLRAVDLLDCRGHRTRAGPSRLAARRAAIYLASTCGNLGSKALARASGFSRSNLRHHLAAVEDARETDRALDSSLDELTIVMSAALATATRRAAA